MLHTVDCRHFEADKTEICDCSSLICAQSIIRLVPSTVVIVLAVKYDASQMSACEAPFKDLFTQRFMCQMIFIPHVINHFGM